MDGIGFYLFTAVCLLLISAISYARGFANGRAAAMASMPAPPSAVGPVDERPPEHRPAPGENLSPTSLMQDAVERGDALPFPFEIGQRFNYLGLQLICTKHIRRGEPLGSARGITAMAAWTDAIVAEYVSGDGRIQQHSFESREWAAIRAEGTRTGTGYEVRPFCP